MTLSYYNAMSDSDADDCGQSAVLITDEVEEVREGERKEAKYSEEEDVDSPEDDGERVEVVEVASQVIGLNGLTHVKSGGHGTDAAHEEVEVGAEEGGQGGQGKGGGEAGGGAEVGGEGEVEAVRDQDHGDDVGRDKEVLIELEYAGGDGCPVYQVSVVHHALIVMAGWEIWSLQDVIVVLHVVVLSGHRTDWRLEPVL